jgi:hypothetical protein
LHFFHCVENVFFSHLLKLLSNSPGFSTTGF